MVSFGNSSNFSLFQLKKKRKNYGQCWPFMVSIQKTFFGTYKKTAISNHFLYVVIFNFLNKMQQSQARMKIKNLFKITQCEKKKTHGDQTLYKVTFQIFHKICLNFFSPNILSSGPNISKILILSEINPGKNIGQV